MSKKPIIYLITMCWNEELIIPYFLAHYDFVDKIIVYDNESTDNSIALLSANPKVQIKTYKSNNQIRDDLYLDIKNNAWKQYRNDCDIVIVCDMDEFLYHPNIPQLMFKFNKSQCTIIKPVGYDMIAETHDFNYSIPLTQQITEGVRNVIFDKLIVFKPQKIQEIGYRGGCHYANPSGDVNYYNVDGVKLLHYKRLSRQYILDRMKAYSIRLSEYNKKYALGYEYAFAPEKHNKDYDDLLSKKEKVL